MLVLTSIFNNSITAVYPTAPRNWDMTTQTAISVPDDSTETVETPDGGMLLTEALMQRTGAFSVVDGVLVHDEGWVPPDI